MEAVQKQQPKRMKGLRFATRCATLEQFIALFQRVCDGQSVFVSTNATRPVGLETAFSIDLIDGKPALRGLGIVLDAWDNAQNPFGRPGIHLGIRRLTKDTEALFEQLLVARAAAEAERQAGAAAEAERQAAAEAERQAAPVAPADTANTDVQEPPKLPKLPAAPEEGPRTPGADLVLPANPLAGIGDDSLQGFVDCTIYEETGSYFLGDPVLEEGGDSLIEPPVLAPLRPTPPSGVRPPASGSGEGEEAPALIVAPPPVEPPPPPPAAFAVPPLQLPGDDLAVPRTKWWSTMLHDRRRWWLLGAAVAVPILVIVLAIAWSGSSRAAQPEPGAAPPPAHDVAAQPPEPTVVAPPGAPQPDEPGADEPSASGTPVVGKGPCQITVASTPAGSVVEIDGERVGPSPITIAGPCEKRQLAISHERYETTTRVVTPSEGKPAQVDVMLQRPMHHLMINSTPSGAIVSIAGRRAGVTPTNVDIMGFTSIDVTITKPTFQTVTKRVYSKVPSDHLSITLAK